MKVEIDTVFNEIREIRIIAPKEEKIQILKRLINELEIKDIITSGKKIILFTNNNEVQIEVLSEVIIITTKCLDKILEVIGYYDEKEADEKTRWGE